MHTVVHTPMEARNLQLVESCKLSSLYPSTKLIPVPALILVSIQACQLAQPLHAARKLLPSQQHNVSKKLFSMATVDCKVQSALNDLSGEERVDRSADHPGGCHKILAGKKYFRYLEKGGLGRIVSNHL